MYVLDQNKKNRFYYIKVGFEGGGGWGKCRFIVFIARYNHSIGIP